LAKDQQIGVTDKLEKGVKIITLEANKQGRMTTETEKEGGVTKLFEQ